MEDRGRRLLAHLRSGPRCARWLAERLGVSVRTVHRDVARLRSRGFAVLSRIGRRGCFLLGPSGRIEVKLDYVDVRQLVGALVAGFHNGGLVAGRRPASLIRGLLEMLPNERAARVKALFGEALAEVTAPLPDRRQFPRLRRGLEEAALLGLEDCLAEGRYAHVLDREKSTAQICEGVIQPLSLGSDGWRVEVDVHRVAFRGVPQQRRSVAVQHVRQVLPRHRWRGSTIPAVSRRWGEVPLRPPVHGPDVPVPIRVPVEPVLSSIGRMPRWPDFLV